MTATTRLEHDVLDGDWQPDTWWSTSNMGEAVPGVLTPLNWTFWGPASERALRQAFVNFGALEAEHAGLPADDRERIMGLFHGRLAARVSFLGDMGDRLPGTTGAAIAEQILGTLPPDFRSAPTRRRLPAIARRFPPLVLQAAGDVRALHAETAPWWQARVAAGPTASLPAAQAGLREAAARFERAMRLHIECTFAVVQPLYDQVLALAVRAGDPSLAGRLLAGQGAHAELDVVGDLWAVSREQLPLATFLARHGYHGPHEGEISSRVWREDPAPVITMARTYAARGDAQGPEAVLADRAEERRRAERELLAALPRARRPVAETLLRLSARYVPLRGVGKVAFLQTLDAGRAAARRIGELLAADGHLREADDVAFLTLDEACAPAAAADLGDRVAARRAIHEDHLAVVLPGSWRGRPEVLSAPDRADDRAGLTLHGIAASGGEAEGRARVVLDPSFADVEDGEVLIAPFTDPSWASIMFTSAALVVDIGGELSHAAVVARELGIPCVMGTGDGTRRIEDGDLVRVNGTAGTVEVLATTTKEEQDDGTH